MQCTIILAVPPVKGRGHETIMMPSTYTGKRRSAAHKMEMFKLEIIETENVENRNVLVGMVLFWPSPLIGARKLIALPQAPSTCWEGPGDVRAHSLEKLASFLGSSIFSGAHMYIIINDVRY